MQPSNPDNATATHPAAAPRRAPLTKREREILGLLSEGMSGSQIAAQLVLSPETVRTHVRNAMAKLGASTRSQAVALALRSQELVDAGAPPAVGGRSNSSPPARDPAAALDEMLGKLVALYDVDGGAIYLTGGDGISLRQVAAVDAAGAASGMPSSVALGDGALGRAALERRTQLVLDPNPAHGRGALIATPILGSGRLMGVIALTTRVSRPVGRNEQLLLQAFSNRVGEILGARVDVERRLNEAMDGFRSSWSSTPQVG